MYDELGPAYTLLVRDRGIDCNGFTRAAQTAGIPVKVLDVSAEKAVPDTYRHGLLICRSDQHVVWRTDAWPAQYDSIIALLRGGLSAEHHAAHERSTRH
jgi:hypothetical protein